MTTSTNSKFEIKSWDEAPYLELDEGRKFTRASVVQRVIGDIEGESTSETLMYYRPDGTARYTGLAHIVGRIGDREGSFVLESTGDYDGTTARSTSVVVAGSGTGDLAGLRGTGGSASSAADYPHVPFTLDYDVE
jgi:hypothetical protein